MKSPEQSGLFLFDLGKYFFCVFGDAKGDFFLSQRFFVRDERFFAKKLKNIAKNT